MDVFTFIEIDVEQYAFPINIKIVLEPYESEILQKHRHYDIWNVEYVLKWA